MVEYRPVPDEREEEFAAVTRYAFAAESGPYDPEEELAEWEQRRYDFGEPRGMFDGGDLLAVCKHIRFDARVRGARVPLAGLSAVASPPEHRRRGLVGEMLAASLSEYRDRGWPLSALYPFSEAFYARYGWATGSRYTLATVEPEALSVTTEDAAGSFRRVGPDEHAELQPLFDEWLDGAPLATDRSDDWWRDRVFVAHGGELYATVWERDGDPRGYLVYEVDEGDAGRRLRTHEFVATDHEAYVNLLRFCYNHDSQVEEVELYGPDHRRVLDVVEDRGAVEVEVASGPMVRVVDVPAALEIAAYPGVDAADVTVGVADDHAPWNDGTFDVRVRDGAATVVETDAAPDATVDVGTLSQLYVGHHGVERARALGGLVVETDGAAGTLAALFPEREPYLPDKF